MTPEPLEVLFLSAGDVAALGVAAEDVFSTVEAAVRAQGEGKVTLDPRTHHVPDPAFPGHFNVLRATVWPLEASGVKVVGDFVENYRRGLPSELALVTLYDPRTGVPLALLDATEITKQRTGALTALGARALARKDSRVLAHIGARGTAFANVEQLDRLFGFDEIRVTSRRAASRQAFAARLEAGLGRPGRVTEEIEEAVVGADIVVEATRLVSRSRSCGRVGSTAARSSSPTARRARSSRPRDTREGPVRKVAAVDDTQHVAGGKDAELRRYRAISAQPRRRPRGA